LQPRDPLLCSAVVSPPRPHVLRARFTALLLAAAGCRSAPPAEAPAPRTIGAVAEDERARTLAAILSSIEDERFDEARRRLARARQRWPDDPVFEALDQGLPKATPRGQPSPPTGPPAPAAAADAPVVALRDAPWVRTLRAPVPDAPLVGRPTIRRIHERRNRITNVRPWFQNHGFFWPKVPAPDDPRLDAGELTPPHEAAPPSEVPASLAGEPLAWVIFDGPYLLALYERRSFMLPTADPHAERPVYPQVLAIYDETGRRLAAVDFSALRLSPKTRPEDWTIAQQDLIWAHYDGRALYVAHGHWTYASTSGGQTGYVTALDPRTGRLYWRSEPRVANAQDFAVWGPYLVTGYGFTKEPDRLVILRKLDGEVMATRRVASAPTYLVLRSATEAGKAQGRPVAPARLFVRTYDRDYEFELRPGRLPPADDPVVGR